MALTTVYALTCYTVIYKVPIGHQGRDSPITGALKEAKIIIIIIKNTTL